MYFLLISLALAQAPANTSVVVETHQLRFHSDVWMNLHHTLYAAAWARRPDGDRARSLSGDLPSPLDAALSGEERRAWDAAVDYYDKTLANRDLLFDDGMERIKSALAAGDLSSAAVGAELRGVLESAAPVYRRHYWPAHDRANREWIAATVERLNRIAPQVIPRLETLYEATWFSSPVRVDAVWVANRQGAYTSTLPPHAVVSTGPSKSEWTPVEIVFHEVSHVLVRKIFLAMNAALGERVKQNAPLWHVVQFYLTGVAVQEALRDRGIEYVPYVYSTGLMDRAWGRYKKPVEDNWAPYVAGKVGLEEAIKKTVAAVS